MKKNEGFTLIEVLISMLVGAVIIAAITAAVVSTQKTTGNIERQVVAGQDARAALELMAIEIQMASYNPDYALGIWANPANCEGLSVNQNYFGIQTATASSINVQADINNNGGVLRTPPAPAANDNPSEIITYTYDAANQYITREAGCGGNMAFLGETVASGRPRSVRVINTAAVPVFRYFNAQGVEITAAGLPAGIRNIARIDITLWVETDEIDSNTGERRRMVYSTSVIPRNHVIND